MKHLQKLIRLNNMIKDLKSANHIKIISREQAVF
jgi:hypothetical protein